MTNPTPTPLASTAMAGSVKLAITCIRLSGRIQGDVPDDVLQHWGAVQDMSRLIDRHFQPLLAKVEGERDELKRMLGNRRDQVFVDASPDEALPTRILSGYLDHGETISNPPELGLLMNKWQAERNEIINRAITGLNQLQSLRADLAAKEADTAILDWLEKNATICAKYRREPPAFAHTGPHYWAIDWGKYGNETTLTLREAARSALASRADKGGAT